jgi:putative acetyltransferase
MADIIPATTPAHLDEIRRLFTTYAAELGADFHFQGFQNELAALPGKYAPPAGELLLAFDTAGIEQAIGCVALRPLAEGTPQPASPETNADMPPGRKLCEMKRLYVEPPLRKTGLGRRLAEKIIDIARSRGYTHMRLDTLDTLVPAMRLYESLGFTPIPPYYDNPLSGVVYFESTLNPEL